LAMVVLVAEADLTICVGDDVFLGQDTAIEIAAQIQECCFTAAHTRQKRSDIISH